ncbi:glycerophosphodiester phosphodiesterase [Oceaniserpentilla sp. 4NH20-0058]|uniref:glycerophosphodiester phosphodiesterase n=1 Tax=Oceaniserpentilla sp. 4NH20-0058 TaxID=3127660 RepID=UPI003109284D
MKIYGHRGAKGIIMENSIKGFKLAVSQGIDRFELDIRLSSDGQLMVIHDEKLNRLTHTDLLVSKSHSEDLKRTELKGINEGIPTLEDVVKACPSVKHWQFEIKTQRTEVGFIKPMLELIKSYQLEDNVVITSKHIGTLKAFQKHLPDIARGYVQEWHHPNGLKTAINLGCDFLCLNKTLARKQYIKQAQAKNLHVSVWTVNKIEDMTDLFKLGADSIISDFPQQAKETLTVTTA